MANPFEEISTKLDALIASVSALEKKNESSPSRIPLLDFCEEFGISRPTAYAWAARRLIALEKVGGRRYVRRDSISIVRKYQRESLVA